MTIIIHRDLKTVFVHYEKKKKNANSHVNKLELDTKKTAKKFLDNFQHVLKFIDLALRRKLYHYKYNHPNVTCIFYIYTLLVLYNNTTTFTNHVLIII